MGWDGNRFHSIINLVGIIYRNKIIPLQFKKKYYFCDVKYIDTQYALMLTVE